MKSRVTHTFVELEVSREAYLEIYRLLAEAGYHHAFIEGAIDMHGIALTMRDENEENEKGEESSTEGEAAAKAAEVGLGVSDVC